MSDTDPAATYERLRIETAAMLRLNADSASLVEGLQVDLVALLRLEIDTLQGAVLAGDSVDLGRLASALGMLRQLLPEKSLVASPTVASETRFGPDHRARLRHLIETTVLAASVADPGEVERTAELMRREELASVIAAGGNVEAAPAPSTPDPITPPPSERANVVPLHYLKAGQGKEPWRDYYDGVVTGPSSWPLPR